MANKSQPKQILLDTAFAVTVPMLDRLYKGDIIQWNLTGGAAGNQAVIKSVDDTIIYNGLASIANYVDRITLNRDYLEGFYIPTLSAGGIIIITRASGRSQ